MRISNLLFCTLVAVIARELPQVANAAVPEPFMDDNLNDASSQEPTDMLGVATTYVSMAIPDVIDVSSFSSHLDPEQFANDRFVTSGLATSETDWAAAPTPSLAFANHRFAAKLTLNELDGREDDWRTEEESGVDALIDPVESIDAVDPRKGLEDSTRFQLSQLPLEPPALNLPEADQEIIDQLFDNLEQPSNARAYRSSPSITVSNPSGFGSDNFTGFVGFGYQSRTRFGNEDDGGAVVGMGFGDARKNLGVQLSYTVASFGGSRDVGTGGFNAKLHKRVSEEWSIALGWEGFATTGFVDFEDSIYASASHIIRIRDRITRPFSRVALTTGLGNGRFRTEDAIFDDRDDIGVFGSAAVRVVEPVSAIVEWTGQDVAAGLSITPFRNFPIVLLPAVRDITGAGDGARFVMGAGLSVRL